MGVTPLRRLPWWQGVAPVRFGVDCGGRRHHISWQDGRIVLEDHPHLVAERALVALGGDRPPCVELLDIWRDGIGDGGFLYEWASHVREDPAWQRRFFEKWSLARADEAYDLLLQLKPDRAVRVGAALALFPHALHDRMALAVARRLDRQWQSREHISDLDGEIGELSMLLAESVAARTRTAFVSSLARVHTHRRPDALVPFAGRLVPPGVRADIIGVLAPVGSFARLIVPLSWLTEVWGRGLSVVDGYLVLRVLGARPDGGLAVDAVRWERRADDPGASSPLVARASVAPDADGRFHLRWECPSRPVPLPASGETPSRPAGAGVPVGVASAVGVGAVGTR